jgi:lipoyl(octanoyl) transferase
MSRRLAVARCGRVDYGEAVVWQERLVARRLTGPPDTLLLLEHPPVYTLGRGADARHLGAAASGPIPAVRAHRGGEVTYHGPGQLVGYPVVDLRALRPDVRWYVGMLEQVLIDTLSDLGIAGRRERGLVGVWVGPRKIGSIGIAVRRWIAWHGFALNVAEDLSGFEAITPCGLAGMEMTSVAREGGPSSVSAVAPLVLSRFVTAFGYGGWDELREPAAAGAPA